MGIADKQPPEPTALDPTVINRFLAQQLTEIEVAQVEKQLLSNPGVAREAEATARLKVGLQKLREDGELDALLQPPPRSYRTTFTWLAAAIVLLSISVLAGRLVSKDTEPLLVASIDQLAAGDGGQRLRTSDPYPLVRTRSSNRVVIDLPQARQALKLRVFPRLGARPPYRVSIAVVESAGERTLASITVPSADEDLFVTAFLDSKTLQPGDYVLLVASAGAVGDSQERFEIQVRKPVDR